MRPGLRIRYAKTIIIDLILNMFTTCDHPNRAREFYLETCRCRVFTDFFRSKITTLAPTATTLCLLELIRRLPSRVNQAIHYRSVGWRRRRINGDIDSTAVRTISVKSSMR